MPKVVDGSEKFIKIDHATSITVRSFEEGGSILFGRVCVKLGQNFDDFSRFSRFDAFAVLIETVDQFFDMDSGFFGIAAECLVFSILVSDDVHYADSRPISDVM